jgi:arsenate reductase (thioredoxin)
MSLQPTRRKRVLFVCIGNACRSQMAEGFARFYGGDAVEAESAGIAPLGTVPRLTCEAMREKSVDVTTHRTKGIDEVRLQSYDVIVNMSGFPLPPLPEVKVLEWTVADPFGGKLDRFRRTRDDLDGRVRELVAGLKAAPAPKSDPATPSPTGAR